MLTTRHRALVAPVLVLAMTSVLAQEPLQPVREGASSEQQSQQAPKAPSKHSSPTTPSAHPKVLIGNPDGVVWEVLPPGEAHVVDRCERPAGFAGIKAGTFGARCTYLTCRWLTDLAECIEKFMDTVIGNECDEKKFKEIKATQDEATLVCSSLVKDTDAGPR